MTHVNQRNSQPPNVHQDARPASRNRALSSSVHNFLRSQFRRAPRRRCRSRVVRASFAHGPVLVRSFAAPCSAIAGFRCRIPDGHRRFALRLSRLEVLCRTAEPHAIARPRTHAHAPVRSRAAARAAARHVSTLRSTSTAIFRAGVRAPRRKDSVARRARAMVAGGNDQVAPSPAPTRSPHRLRRPGRLIAREERSSTSRACLPVGSRGNVAHLLDSPPLSDAHHAVLHAARPERRGLPSAHTPAAGRHQAAPE
ncbi:uncharacterized protein SOCE836_038440 [Sorangium cellulosum]|uniref:Uncharacterized protein n=1 Tax=Sorangium cellulosum TaxID=56 RepID=A0A4P2QQC6_SORCE|nr:uncharacterized protein SOCE836_038440 [Sorangium cellulosum]WCQ91090.1 hypothetical protein NQZ70_03805 [Sorangium sp. Soce836]